jgi:hypothetical protein
MPISHQHLVSNEVLPAGSAMETVFNGFLARLPETPALSRSFLPKLQRQFRDSRSAIHEKRVLR